MAEINLREKFPQMQPIHSAPSLYHAYGCGVGVYGSRDRDAETGTYVKTQCISIFWIPVLALKAFRVADADRGWYFLGREPLSSFAKTWNMLLLAGLLSCAGVAAWHVHTSSPDFVAGRQLAEAEQLAADGRLAEAARIECGVITGSSRRAGEAREALKDLLDHDLPRAKGKEAAATLAVIQEFEGPTSGPPIVPDLAQRGTVMIGLLADSDPGGAVAVLDVIAPLVKDGSALASRREPLLEKAVAREPDNADLLSKLALIYEDRNDTEKCVSLLTPHKDSLGVSEGARILGQIYARQGDFEASFALLSPYAEGRLNRLHAVEKEYDATVERISDQMIEELRQGKAPDSFYRRYEQASESEKKTMVNEYVVSGMRNNPEIAAKQEALRREASVVPVALDLGIVRLRRAQAMTDEDARRSELEAAEKTFLAIRGVAGESDTFRLFLGQVDYWLGKHEEGRKLLDELLASKNRDFESLMSVAAVLRGVGAEAESRSLAEEAYNKETDRSKKQQAAQFRSLALLDLDDEIKWLRLADQADPHVKASLSKALGTKAAGEGNNTLAARHLREAIAVYESQIQNDSVLNNAALAYFLLFQVSGDREAYTKGVEKLDKAVALDPSDSILLFNAATTILDGALADIIGDKIDLQVLSLSGDIDLLRYLYKDAAGREPFRQRVRSHPDVVKALAYYDKVLVLSPKNTRAYAGVASVYSFLRDAKALEELRRRIEKVKPAAADVQQQTLDFYAGKQDAKYRKDYEGYIARFTKTVERTRASSRDATFAVAVGYLIRNQMAGSMVGMPVDADALVSLAQEAHGGAPSSATRSAAIAALLFRASQTLSKECPPYAAMVSRAGHALSPSHLIAAAMSEPGQQREAALGNPDVRRAVALIVEGVQAFPETSDAWEWAMLRFTEPQEAAKVAQAIQQDEAGRVEAEMDRLLRPVDASHAIDAYWLALLAGNEGGARDALKSVVARGVPIPFEMK